jgi:hypothetical protein
MLIVLGYLAKQDLHAVKEAMVQLLLPSSASC